MKHKRGIAFITVFISALFFLYTIISFANKSYPLVGHDFRYFIPHLLDSYIHYKVNGLSIQWYTPSFGGGLPAYPNPQHVQFTLAALLMAFTGPWSAIWASNVIFILTGFISSYFLFEDIFEFDPLASAIGSIVFNVNGFVFSHAIVGHLGYQAFPLLPLILLVLFHQRLKLIYRGVLLALILSINIHSGGFYVIVIYIFSLLITIPILIILRPHIFSWKDLTHTLILTMLFTLMLSGSKLFAVSSYMRWFPRQIEDQYNVNLFHGTLGVFLQLFGSTTLLTIENFLGIADVRGYAIYARIISGAKYGLWEFDIGTSPAALILCGLLLIFYVFTQKRKRMELKVFLLLALSLFGVWLTTEFRFTNGLIYSNIRYLPIIKSLHVNLRFTAAYLLPISALSALGFKHLQQKLNFNFRILVFFFLLSAFTLIPLITYASSPVTVYEFDFDIDQANSIYQNAKENKAFYIKSIKHISDLDVFKLHASSSKPYEPIFGYYLEDFHPLTHQGRVELIEGNYFNLTNPASLIFPGENNLFMFEKINTSEQKKLDQFINYKQPNWKRPVIQNILDILMLCSAVLIPLVSLIDFKRQILRGKDSKDD